MIEQFVLNWITLSSIYLLISFGFSLVYGVLRIFHFGYTVTYTLTPYLVWIFWKEFGLDLISSFALMIILQILFAAAFYKRIIKPLFIDEGKLFTISLLIWIFLEELINYKYPPTAGVNIPVRIFAGTIKIGSASISSQLLLLIIVCAVFVSIFTYFILKTRTGLTLRALSQNVEAAELVGVDTDKYYLLAIIISVFPPIICLSFVMPIWEIDPYMGFPLLLSSLLITIMGGVGNLKGTIIGSFIAGFVYATVGFFWNPRYMFLVMLILTVIILLVRPKGLVSTERVW